MKNTKIKDKNLEIFTSVVTGRQAQINPDRFTVEDEEQIAKEHEGMVSSHFLLCANGFNSKFHPDQDLKSCMRYDRVWCCVNVIRLCNFIKSRYIQRCGTSYGLKHMVERSIQYQEQMGYTYLANGECILAMTICGFRFKVSRGINACFNLHWGKIYLI